eukprot:CAMPEP_0114424252 /NCGR_PEP_ID=MMETSP0103-20121206/6594_1 /TAXON_ID=37642 ORGANISM="Paraphysomonas imperforata, Strain PA2" /NCGR_SAMPLE_ID=MMETSP0103 /ASSEMBLY_ACC=CAM_ASM_000201 /LENGTH=620 /DNA_ID=CAMNT_0001592991 /DNA_START=82 /DNA_END=1944 /DNA_ORIENTATION=-
MSVRGSGNSKKQVSFSSDVKEGANAKLPRNEKKGVLAKHPSDMSAFERISYVNSLDFEKEEQKEREDVNEDVDDGELTKDVAKKFLAVHAPVTLKKVHYKLQVDPSKLHDRDKEQTSILKEEVTSNSPDLMRVVQCLERGADPNTVLDRSQAKPLHAVIRRGDARLVDFLLQAGADVNCTDARNQTPLAKACDSQRVDRGYLQMVETLLAHPDISKGLEYRDAGSNTALLNAIFRSNVWLTRLLLKKKAKVTTGKRNAYDVATFIMANHIHLDVEEIPEFLLHPPSRFYKTFSFKGRYHSWKEVFWQSLSNSDIELVFRMVQYRYRYAKTFSFKGRYHSWKEVFWQSLSNSDIELVFRMVQYRHEELEREQRAGKAKGEEPEVVKPVVDIAIGGSAEAKRVKRLEQQMRRKRLRAERKEQEQRELWEREKAAMVARVDEEFSIKVYRNPQQKWEKKGSAQKPPGVGNKWIPSTAGQGYMEEEEMSALYADSLGSKGRSGLSKAAYQDTQENSATVNKKNTSSRPKYGSSDSLATDVTITEGASKGRGAQKAKAAARPLRHSVSSSDLDLDMTPTGKRWTVKSVDYDSKLYAANPAPGVSIVSFREGAPPLPPRESRSAGK